MTSAGNVNRAGSSMTRLPNWPRLLHAFVDETRTAPFEWSWQDCCVWALRALDAMCGTGHAALIRGQYADGDGAIAYGALRGWRTAADACAEFCGEPLARPSRMQRGDILYRPLDSYAFGTLLVYVGDDQIVGPDANGLMVFPRRIAMVGTMTAYPGAR